jgi:predicted nucleotidyltransferase
LKEISHGKAQGTGVITKHHSHHYFGFAETAWKLFLKQSPNEAQPQTVGQASGLPVKGASGPVSRLQNLTCLQRIVRFKDSRRVKPLLYVYRVLLTGIHLMQTGEVESNLVKLNEIFRLPYIADLIARKTSGENTSLDDADLAFHESEYQRLRAQLQAAHEASSLPEVPSEQTRAALDDLLVRVRTKGIEC